MVKSCQKKLEAQNYATRKAVLEYDDVMSKQRGIIYGERNKVLEGVDIHDQILKMFPDVVEKVIYGLLSDEKPYFEWDLDEVNDALEDRLFPKGTNLLTEEFVEDCEVRDVYDKVLDKVYERYENVIKQAEELNFDFSKLERYFLLRVVDVLWMDHIDTMDILKKEIGLQAYGGHDPVVEYKREGYDMFEKMIEKINEDTCTFLLNVKINQPPQIKVKDKIQTQTNQKTTVQAKNEKIVGRNEPCPCGSGKKYKNCCGKN